MTRKIFPQFNPTWVLIQPLWQCPILAIFSPKVTLWLILCLTVLSFQGRSDTLTPTIRIITFHGKSAWKASQTTLEPTSGGLYKTTSLGAEFKLSTDSCGDLLSSHQKRALDAMLAIRYIIPEFYKQLTDPSQRSHGLSQYILATSYLDMPREQAESQRIPKERILENIGDQLNFQMVRVHMGSLSILRGYEIERRGIDSFKVVPRLLPWEIGKLPEHLTHPLNRENILAVAEFGRALVETGAPAGELKRLMKVLVSALSADAHALGLDPGSFALFGHGLDTEHVRMFAAAFPARLMTPEMQTQLELSPAEFFKHYLQIPRLTSVEWKSVHDGVVVGSLAQLKSEILPTSSSAVATALKPILPNLSDEARQTLMREFSAAFRDDYDYLFHDPHRPGQRRPIQVRDFGSALFVLKLVHALDRHGIPRNEKTIHDVLNILTEDTLHVDPDFAQDDWFEKSSDIPGVDLAGLQQNEKSNAGISVSNLDPELPSADRQTYLATVIMAITSKIEKQILGLSKADAILVANLMNQERTKKGLRRLDLNELNLANFLETYPFTLSSGNENIRTGFRMFGGTPFQGLQMVNQFAAGKTDVQVDFSELNLDFSLWQTNPELVQRRAQEFAQNKMQQLLLGIFKPVTLYRFSIQEIEELRRMLPTLHARGADQYLTLSFHRQRLLRHFNTLQ